MRTNLLFPLAGLAVMAACGGTPAAEQPAPRPSEVQVARERAVQDSIAEVRRIARADSIEQARQAGVIARARADSVERARQAAIEQQGTVRQTGTATVEDQRLREELNEMVHFNFARADLLPAGNTALDRKVEILRANPAVRLRITGACDERGSAAYNMALGNRRAAAVRAYLVAAGINANRLDVESVGKGSPVESASTEAAWAVNRRAEFTVIAGNTLLGMN